MDPSGTSRAPSRPTAGGSAPAQRPAARGAGAAGRGSDRRATGQRGEAIAAEHLRGLGYEIVQANVRTRYGELDIVARDGGVLAFVEVRTRRGPGFGTPEESVGPRKQRRLAELAEAYLQTLPEPLPPCRIDVVAVDLGPDGRALRVELIRGAV